MLLSHFVALVVRELTWKITNSAVPKGQLSRFVSMGIVYWPLSSKRLLLVQHWAGVGQHRSSSKPTANACCVSGPILNNVKQYVTQGVLQILRSQSINLSIVKLIDHFND